MRYNPDIHKRRSLRLKNYDYSQQGAYFVTICAKNRECLFGDIIDGRMKLNDAGFMVRKWWVELKNKFRVIELDEYIIMPNHFHGIIFITSDNCRGEVASPSSLSHVPDTMRNQGGETPPLRKYTVGHMIAYFKYQTSKVINQLRNSPDIPVWQRNYYDRIIRNEKELMKTREYIRNNPLQWHMDKENPANLQGFD